MSTLSLQLGLAASTSVLSSHHFPLILGIMSRIRLGVGIGLGGTTFSDRNVVPRSTKYVDLGKSGLIFTLLQYDDPIQ